MEHRTPARVASNAWRATRADSEAIAVRQQTRLTELFTFARLRLRRYAGLYRDLSVRLTNIRQLPPVTNPNSKRTSMIGSPIRP